MWIKTNNGLFYVLLVSGIFKLASIVMTSDWEPSKKSFLEFESDK